MSYALHHISTLYENTDTPFCLLRITFTFFINYCLFFRYSNYQSQLLAAIGTTAEIFSMKEESDGGIVTLRIKATGRQRFRIKESRRQVDGWVQIPDMFLVQSKFPEQWVFNLSLVCSLFNVAAIKALNFCTAYK